MLIYTVYICILCAGHVTIHLYHERHLAHTGTNVLETSLRGFCSMLTRCHRAWQSCCRFVDCTMLIRSFTVFFFFFFCTSYSTGRTRSVTTTRLDDLTNGTGPKRNHVIPAATASVNSCKPSSLIQHTKLCSKCCGLALLEVCLCITQG